MIGQSAFDAYYGMETVSCSEGLVVASLAIDERHGQPTGVVHGGVYASLAEATASNGTNWSVTPRGEIGLGLSNNTSFLRPAAIPGVLTVTARAVHSGRTTWVWEVEIADADDRLCAISRVTVAVRPTAVPARPAAEGQ